MNFKLAAFSLSTLLWVGLVTVACNQTAPSPAANTNSSAATAPTSGANNPAPETATSSASSVAPPTATPSPIQPTTPSTVNSVLASNNRTPTGGASATTTTNSTSNTLDNSPSTSPSGAKDFAVFTQVRGALNNDEQLKNERITVDVKNGTVLLTGSVNSTTLKSRAEQIARQNGSAVKNQLQIATNK